MTQSIVVLGANGKIGRIFCTEGARAGLPVRAVVRSEDQREFFESQNVEVVIGDLEGEFEQTLDGCDRLVFTAGSGGQTGPDKTMLDFSASSPPRSPRNLDWPRQSARGPDRYFFSAVCKY